MSRSVLAGLTGSALLHGTLVAGLLLLVPRADPLAPLFVDLTPDERPPGEEGGRAESEHAPRVAAPGRPGANRAIRPTTPGSPTSPALGPDRVVSSAEPPSSPIAPAPPPVAPPAPATPAPSAEAAPASTPAASSAPEPVPTPALPKVAAPEVGAVASAATETPAVSPAPSASLTPSDSSERTGAASLADAAPARAPGGGEGRAGTGPPVTASGSGSGDALSPRSPANSGSGLGGASSGLAAVGPGEGTGDPGAAYAAYLGRLRQRVYEALRYPATARRRGLTGTVVLELIVTPNGAISRIVVVDSSSHAALDQAAVESVRSLRPQPFPANLPSRTLHVRLPVVFELQ